MYKKKWFISERVIGKGFYTRTGREILLDEDALTNEEAGFMQGYEDVFQPEELV
tara:strand:- start:8741 stop:8902 length:162 start_codon:yes stop_codon:yes gene_type:complete